MTSSRPSLDPQVESRGGELLGARRGVAERKLVRKLDMRLLPTVGMISIMIPSTVCFLSVPHYAPPGLISCC